MARVYTHQYTPISNYELGVNKPLTTRTMADLYNSMLNAKAHHFNHKIISWSHPGGKTTESDENENVIIAFPPITVPIGYDRIVVTAQHVTYNSDNYSNWYVYASTYPYLKNVITNGVVPGMYSKAVMISNNSSIIQTNVLTNIEIPRDYRKPNPYDVYITLSARNCNATSLSRMVTFHAWPVILEAM